MYQNSLVFRPSLFILEREESDYEVQCLVATGERLNQRLRTLINMINFDRFGMTTSFSGMKLITEELQYSGYLQTKFGNPI